jgi:hypothetical protein
LLVHGVTVGIIVVVGVVVVVGDGGIVIGIVVGSSVVVSVKARNKSYLLYTS